MGGVRVSQRLVIPDAELTISAVRSSGPGGQSVNTTDSKIELRWNVASSSVLTDQDRRRIIERLSSRITGDGDLILRGQEYRSQARNRQAVRARLAALVGDAIAPDVPRRATRPTRGSKLRRMDAKRRRGETKRLRRRPDT